MPEPQTATDRGWGTWLTFHAAFAVLAVAVLMLPWPERGWQVLGLVVVYHVALVAVARWRRNATLWRAWTVLAPLSVVMLLPDWFLSEVLGVLSFPDQGGVYLGTVPLAMAGMWTIALMPVVGIGIAASDRAGAAAGLAAAGLAGGLLFLGAEAAAPLLGLWEPIGVQEVAGIAGYVLLPEVVLSICAYQLVAPAARLPRWTVAWLTLLLPFTYLGLLATSYQFLG